MPRSAPHIPCSVGRLREAPATVNHDRMLQPLPAGKLPGWLLRKVLPGSTRDPDILVGPGLGRDAAAIAVGERVIVAKNDPITFASEGGAAHLVEVNANDVACMGATPRWLLVTALLPHGVTPADVLNQFAELRETCRHRSVELIGGHTEIVPGLGAADSRRHDARRRVSAASFSGQARRSRETSCSSPRDSPSRGRPCWRRERADELRDADRRGIRCAPRPA